MQDIEKLKQYAQKMRDKPTHHEKQAIIILQQNNIEYRHQFIIEPYIADFLLPEHNIIVEINGGYHDTKRQRYYDHRRYEYLTQKGYLFVSCKNEKLDTLIKKISKRIIPNPFKGTRFLSFELASRLKTDNIIKLHKQGRLRYSNRYRGMKFDDMLNELRRDVFRSMGILI